MSFHVFIAKPGWKKTWQDNPITNEEWISAVNTTEELEKITPPQSNQKIWRLGTQLEHDKTQRLGLTQGFVNAEIPNEELIKVMFQLAEKLGAKVYSERVVPYQSTEDWKNRTKKYYARREIRMAVRKRKRWKQRAIFFATVMVIMMLLFLLNRIQHR